MTVKLEQLLVAPDSSIRDVIACIEGNSTGIALVVDGDNRLIDTITDGDIRRGILDGIVLDSPVKALLKRRASSPYPAPLTAPVGTTNAELLRMMNEYTLRHIPLVNDAGQVVSIALISDLVKEFQPPLTAVVMAGGYGTRLHPLTKDIPKPMLPMGDRPLLELIMEQLQQAGIQQVNIATHHRAEKIVKHFGNGKAFGIEINYVTEDRPLGTAGALGLMETPKEPVLVINGDVLTQVNFLSMLSFHREHGADLTVAVRQYDLQVPYGVIECDGPRVRQVNEKPLLGLLVNAGIYLLEPSVYHYIPKERFDMTDLIRRLLEDERPVVGFPIIEYWLDIGRYEEYEQAQKDIRNGGPF
ncbi:nucleotidyltransferase family protein [Chloroflexota bacterium]